MAILATQPDSTTRLIKSRRWIHVNQLELGMYVCDIDRPWLETRFLFQGFRIESMATLRELQAQCSNVMVETEKLANVSKDRSRRACTA